MSWRTAIFIFIKLQLLIDQSVTPKTWPRKLVVNVRFPARNLLSDGVFGTCWYISRPEIQCNFYIYRFRQISGAGNENHRVFPSSFRLQTHRLIVRFPAAYLSFTSVLVVHLLGHGLKLQPKSLVWISGLFSFPPAHDRPLFCGAGSLHMRSRLLEPPPQVLLHVVTSAQCPQLPSTTERHNVVRQL